MQAVQQGRWVMLDHLQLAPVEVAALLGPLLTSRCLHNPQRGEVIRAHPSFRIIATVQTAANSTHAANDATALLWSQAWTPVHLPSPRQSDQLAVLTGRCPETRQLVLPLAAILYTIQLCANPGHGRVDVDAQLPTWPQWTESAAQCVTRTGLKPGDLMLTLAKPQGLHDAVKWCQRMAAFHGGVMERGLKRCTVPPLLMAPADLLALSIELRQAVLIEASDLLFGFAVGLVRPLLCSCFCSQWLHSAMRPPSTPIR